MEVESLVRRFLAKWPIYRHLRDDLLSEAWLAVWEASQKSQDESFLASHAWHRLHHYADAEQGKGMKSARSVRRHRKLGIDPPKQCELNDVAAPDDKRADIWEALLAVCRRPEDEQILRLRADGCKDQEIADRLGMPLTAVQAKRRELQARYEALLGN